MKTLSHFGLALLLAAILLPACKGASLSSRQTSLNETVVNYNDMFRWRDYESASEYAIPSIREDFMAAAESWKRDLNVTDYEINKITLEQSGKEATVVVTRSFYKTPSVTVQRQEIRQRWIQLQGNWYLAGPPY